jgi:Glycosyl transferase family 2
MSERVFAVVSVYDKPELLPHFLDHYTRLGVHQILVSVRSSERADLFDAAYASAEPFPANVSWTASEYFADSDKAELEQDLLHRHGLAADDYVMHLDLDEFQEYPAPLSEIVRLMNDRCDWALRGWILDRVAEDGTLAPIGATPTIGEQFPIGCDVTRVTLGAWTQKIVLCRGRVRLQGGVRHDTVNAWYHEVPFGRPDQYLVHHFKWTEGLDARLEERLERAAIGPAYVRECRRFLQAYRASGRIDLTDPSLNARWLGRLRIPTESPANRRARDGPVCTAEGLRDWYFLYFRRFREQAPAQLLDYGYQTGEPNVTAASLESLVCFANSVGDPDAMVLNAGAGASSWVLRKLFRNVICTDPDPGYMRFIADLCGRHGLSTDGFVYPLRNCPPADYSYFDYGPWGVRWLALAVAWGKTKSAMYVDDTDDRPHNLANRAFALKFSREAGVRLEDRPDAIDRYGRWGSILRRDS